MNTYNFETNMKPLLGQLVQEAVKLALIDVVAHPQTPEEVESHTTGRLPTDEERAAWLKDIYSMPEGMTFDPVALGQATACRLLGTGGWEVNGVYAGNATPQQVFDACMSRPNQDPNAELAEDLRKMGFESFPINGLEDLPCPCGDSTRPGHPIGWCERGRSL